jgi:transposase
VTDTQKKTIGELRAKGQGYREIAEELGISINTIKSYCQRSGLTGSKDHGGTQTGEREKTCKQCGAVLQQHPNMKTKTFCSAECRIRWWSKNRSQSAGASTVEKRCKQCGRSFRSHASAERKFCGHACYVRWKVARYDAGAV